MPSYKWTGSEGKVDIGGLNKKQRLVVFNLNNQKLRPSRAYSSLKSTSSYANRVILTEK